jgi:hypothetical protein
MNAPVLLVGEVSILHVAELHNHHLWSWGVRLLLAGEGAACFVAIMLSKERGQTS